MSFAVGLAHGNCDTASCPCKNIGISNTIWTDAEHGNIERIIQRVNKQKNIVNKLDSYGYSALHYAAQHNHDEIVIYLLQHGASVDFNMCGATPLHRAAFCGHLKCCMLLVEHGADINAQDYSFGDMNTPIHKAAIQNHSDVVKYLLECSGVDSAILNSNKQTVFDIINLPNNSSVTSFEAKPSNNNLNQVTAEENQIDEPICSKCMKSSFTFTRNANNSLVCLDCRYGNK